MRTLELPLNATPTQWGEVHGETYAQEIAEVARMRTGLCLTVGGFSTQEEVFALAAKHLPLLRAFDTDLHDELLGIAAGSGCTKEEIIVVNHYTDMRDMGPLIAGADECTVVLAETREGPFLAQTWDMHASANDFLLVFKVPETGTAPAAWVLSITGCVGMSGMNSAGVGCTINNLRSTDAHVGIVWPALVRRVLREKSAVGGRNIVMGANIGSGHHYLTADASAAFGIETSGKLKECVHRGTPGNFIHTNHCLDSTVGDCTTVSDGSTTYRRYDWMADSIARRAIDSGDDLWHRLTQAGGVWLDNDSPDPHAAATCGVISMDLTRRSIRAIDGSSRTASPTHFGFEANDS
jgi:isopenicillin-N N-acyltransferase-like protein